MSGRYESARKPMARTEDSESVLNVRFAASRPSQLITGVPVFLRSSILSPLVSSSYSFTYPPVPSGLAHSSAIERFWVQ